MTSNYGNIDKTYVQTWRSEGLKALSELPEFASGKVGCSQQVACELEYELVKRFPELGAAVLSVNFQSLHDQIISPAVGLALKLQTSPDRYDWNFDAGALYTEHILVHHDMIVGYILKDLVSRMSVKISSPVQIEEKGYIGNWLMSLEPGLSRVKVARDSTSCIILRKETFIVKLSHRIGKGSKKN